MNELMKPLDTQEEVETFEKWLEELSLTKLNSLVGFYWLEGKTNEKNYLALSFKANLVKSEIKRRTK